MMLRSAIAAWWLMFVCSSAADRTIDSLVKYAFGFAADVHAANRGA